MPIDQSLLSSHVGIYMLLLMPIGQSLLSPCYEQLTCRLLLHIPYFQLICGHMRWKRNTNRCWFLFMCFHLCFGDFIAVSFIYCENPDNPELGVQPTLPFSCTGAKQLQKFKIQNLKYKIQIQHSKYKIQKETRNVQMKIQIKSRIRRGVHSSIELQRCRTALTLLAMVVTTEAQLIQNKYKYEHTPKQIQSTFKTNTNCQNVGRGRTVGLMALQAD